MLDKAIKSGKEKRKKYYGLKEEGNSHRNHGSCDYCCKGRQHNAKKRELSSIEKLNEYNY